MRSINELLQSGLQESNVEHTTSFNGLVADYIGVFNDREVEILNEVERVILGNAKKIANGHVRPMLSIRVKSLADDKSGFEVYPETGSNPCLRLELEVKSLLNDEGTILEDRMTKAIVCAMAERLLPLIREGNPGAYWDSEYGRIVFG